MNEIVWIGPGRQSSLPPFEVERATPNQIARVRGEWERMAIGHVRRPLPQAREPYLVQARRTLRRAAPRHRREKAAAAAALDACLGHATDENTEAGVKRWRAELAAELAQPQSGQ